MSIYVATRFVFLALSALDILAGMFGTHHHPQTMGPAWSRPRWNWRGGWGGGWPSSWSGWVWAHPWGYPFQRPEGFGRPHGGWGAGQAHAQVPAFQREAMTMGPAWITPRWDWRGGWGGGWPSNWYGWVWTHPYGYPYHRSQGYGQPFGGPGAG